MNSLPLFGWMAGIGCLGISIALVYLYIHQHFKKRTKQKKVDIAFKKKGSMKKDPTLLLLQGIHDALWDIAKATSALVFLYGASLLCKTIIYWRI
ncbi:hypothetical protein Q7M76_04340 [Candidatus Liberibacter asiaticus]|uniref:Uncharacterized protein n=2 Tax=Liberibacter asiaticus TaxID=34021 RepID=C6XGF6_LIBAP|nr:hypothetical protein [Candidatus Liberibacter asiaticus]ACT57459.1 hypothetical protein CLIBASIA_04435 [Candidatus Liberibacter asiaticus str. psy62]AGH17222.1 hypothetical protein WSI_04260 [Candidatus Liberibacter asiaticus str. gxpsy]ALK07519.1 hypothetical protein CD16_04325 [Candidatus Liberibacter asiaticus]ASK53009.1 hypothetical protein B2I23_04390 [Candidatus Liberibacter asiaticus]AWL14335.1 hypothetical protein DIC79_04415 [Candidatus Liberibacter asiaticus]